MMLRWCRVMRWAAHFGKMLGRTTGSAPAEVKAQRELWTSGEVAIGCKQVLSVAMKGSDWVRCFPQAEVAHYYLIGPARSSP